MLFTTRPSLTRASRGIFQYNEAESKRIRMYLRMYSSALIRAEQRRSTTDVLIRGGHCRCQTRFGCARLYSSADGGTHPPTQEAKSSFTSMVATASGRRMYSSALFGMKVGRSGVGCTHPLTDAPIRTHPRHRAQRPIYRFTTLTASYGCTHPRTDLLIRVRMYSSALIRPDQLRQPQNLPRLHVDVNIRKDRTGGQAGHGLHRAAQREDKASANTGPHVGDGHPPPARRPLD
jgi:hypothetical protein